MLSQIPSTEPRECKLADYLVDVLGDPSVLRRYITKANETLEAQSNALEKFAASQLESKPTSRKPGNEYQRITNAIQKNFEADFEYILGARNRTRDYLIPLIEFYYFTYTAQAILQLNRFLDGDRNQCVPLYFCLEWEKTSQNRQCFNEGWNLLQEAVKRIFAHAIVLEILNQTEEGTEQVDYIKINELINSAPAPVAVEERKCMEILFGTEIGRYIEASLIHFCESSKWHLGYQNKDGSFSEVINIDEYTLINDRSSPIMWFGPDREEPLDKWSIVVGKEHGFEWVDQWYLLEYLVDDCNDCFATWYLAECGYWLPDKEEILKECPIEISEADTVESINQKFYDYFNMLG